MQKGIKTISRGKEVFTFWDDPTAEMQKGIKTPRTTYIFVLPKGMTRPQKCKRGLRQISFRFSTSGKEFRMTRPQKCKRGLRLFTRTEPREQLLFYDPTAEMQKGIKTQRHYRRPPGGGMTRPQKCKRGLRHYIPYETSSYLWPDRRNAKGD